MRDNLLWNKGLWSATNEDDKPQFSSPLVLSMVYTLAYLKFSHHSTVPLTVDVDVFVCSSIPRRMPDSPGIDGVFYVPIPVLYHTSTKWQSETGIRM